MMLSESIFPSTLIGENHYSWNDLSDSPLVEYCGELKAKLDSSAFLYSAKQNNKKYAGPSQNEYGLDLIVDSDLSDFDEVIIVEFAEVDTDTDDDDEFDESLLRNSETEDACSLRGRSNLLESPPTPPALPTEFFSRPYDSWEDELFGVALVMPEPASDLSAPSSPNPSASSEDNSPSLVFGPSSGRQTDKKKKKKNGLAGRGRKRSAAEVASSSSYSALSKDDCVDTSHSSVPKRRRRRGSSGKRLTKGDDSSASSSSSSSSQQQLGTQKCSVEVPEVSASLYSQIATLSQQQQQQQQQQQPKQRHHQRQDTKYHHSKLKQQRNRRDSRPSMSPASAAETSKKDKKEASFRANRGPHHHHSPQMLEPKPHLTRPVINLEQYMYTEGHAGSIVVVDSKDGSALLSSLPAEPLSLARPLPEVRDGKIGLVSNAKHCVNDPKIHSMFQAEEVVSLNRDEDEDEDVEIDIL